MRKTCKSDKRIKLHEREFIIIRGALRISAVCEWHSSSKPVRRAGIGKGRQTTMGKTKPRLRVPYSWLINYLFFSPFFPTTTTTMRNVIIIFIHYRAQWRRQRWRRSLRLISHLEALACGFEIRFFPTWRAISPAVINIHLQAAEGAAIRD